MEKPRRPLLSLRRKPLILLASFLLLLFYITPLYNVIGNRFQNQRQLLSGTLDTVSFCQHFPCIQRLREVDSKYLVNTKTCKILDLDPFDSMVTKFLKEGKMMKCQKTLISVRNETLVFNKELGKQRKYVGGKCCYRAISRVTQPLSSYNKNADWGVSISDHCENISRSKPTPVNVPYLKVECTNGSKRILEQYEAVVLPPSKLSNSTREKCLKWDKLRQDPHNNGNIPPSVLIFGIDSISRLHMHRQLKETKKYLDMNDFVEMQGYTKVGENTFPNIMASIGGMEPYNYSCWQKREDKMDDCPLLWKNFSQNGYMTALLEDAPGIAIFNYEKTGFVKQPTDYYLRPLMTAAHLSQRWSKSSGRMKCFGGWNPTEYLMNYMKRVIFESANRYPYFILSWFTNIAHDDLNGLKPADGLFRDFLKMAVENPAYGGDNTLILFISDHGYRFGNFRETFMGFYEESLPFFYIRMPPTLKKRFPDWYKHLTEKTNSLTTPHDMYETLKDILNLSITGGTSPLVEAQIDSDTNRTWSRIDFPRDHAYRKRYSFFESAPTNRTCENSAIPQRFCMCGVTPEVDKKSEKSTQLAKFIISEVNRVQLDSVINMNQCHSLNFSKVLYGRELLPGDIWNNFGKLEKFQDYIIAFEANPGKGHFEARVRAFQNGTKVIMDNVSRINSYKGQSDCIQDYVLKNYCMCKKLVS